MAEQSLDTVDAGADELGALEGLESLAAVVSRQLEQRWAHEPGLLGTICHYALVPTGKLFRPVLLLDSALSVGGLLSSVLPAAVGAECGHVASLIHDDIIDNDDLRRGRASVPHRYGIGDAIVAGDALIFDLFASLAECRHTGVPDGQVVAALEAVARAGLDLCRGQSMEAELCRGLCLDVDSYLTMISLKTAAYFRGVCESGAILGGGPPGLVDTLRGYGEQLGLAFQIHDDLLPYISGVHNTGKPDTSDVRNGRLTLPVIIAHERGTATQREQVRRCLTDPADPVEALTILCGLVDHTDAVGAARTMARDCAEEALVSLEALPPSPSRQRLRDIAELVLTRDR